MFGCAAVEKKTQEITYTIEKVKRSVLLFTQVNFRTCTFNFNLIKGVEVVLFHTILLLQYRILSTLNTFTTSAAFFQALMSTWAKGRRLHCTPPPGETRQTRCWPCSTLAPMSTSGTPTTSAPCSWPRLVEKRKLC